MLTERKLKMAQFTNQAQLLYNGTVTNSNIAVGEISEVLSATKTSLGSTYSPGDRTTYIVSLVNTGDTAFTGVNISDNLGAYAFGSTTVTPLTYVNGTVAYYANGVLQTAPTVNAGPPLVISGITVPANGNATVIYEAEANQYAPPTTDGSITNTVTINGTGVTSVTASNSVTATSEPKLSITKSISPVPVRENDTLTYTFIIQNTGNTPVEASDNVIVTDTFNPILTNLAVTFNGVAWSPTTNYTYNAGTGAFATVGGQITVPAATFTQNPTTGAWITTPGVSTLIISGTV